VVLLARELADGGCWTHALGPVRGAALFQNTKMTKETKDTKRGIRLLECCSNAGIAAILDPIRPRVRESGTHSTGGTSLLRRRSRIL
jgi:hypothetical protein